MEVPDQSGSSFTAQEDHDASQDLIKPFRTAGMRSDEIGESLRIDAARAIRINATELLCLQVQNDL